MDSSGNPVSRFIDRWQSVSLARRMMLAAALWGLVVLIGGALALSALYRAQTLSLLEEDLDQTLVTLTREMSQEGAFLEDGRVTDAERNFLSNDARFQTQYSGRYWSVVGLNPDLTILSDLRSRSLWDEPVPVTQSQIGRAVADPGTTQFADYAGPADQRVRVGAKAILLDLVAAADRTPNDAAATRFRSMLVGTMIALFGGVFAAMVVGIRFSLQPLKRIERDIADIRAGTRQTLREGYPVEVRPLTEELNKLIGHNRDVVERARTHVGNLAHALKTPIAVLKNEAKGDGQLDDVVRRQTETMHANVEHYLKRARMAARAETLGARTNVTPVVESLAGLLNRLFDAKGINVSVENGDGAVFLGEKQDFEEMIGNLMDNACKWAKAEVVVRISDGPQELVIDVEDDGPGLTPAEREGALKRGVRLDETTPGTGLGLSIVTELAELHKGRLELDESALGGLRARLRFPKT